MEGAEAGMEDDLVPRRAQDTPGSLQLGKEISALPPSSSTKMETSRACELFTVGFLDPGGGCYRESNR